MEDFKNAKLMASKQTMVNGNFWKCITDKECADQRPTMWFTLLHPNVPQRLLRRNGPYGLLARTSTWWEHVPATGNIEWHDFGTCGNMGLKNPMFRSYEAFYSEVHKAVTTGGEMKRKCVVLKDCPPWPKFDCGEPDGLLKPVMPKRRVWAEHMEVRAITGKLVKEQVGKVARDDPRIYRWQDTEMWEGKQRWPVDPFVAGFYDFMSMASDFEPEEDKVLAGQDYLLLNLCCTLLMSSSSKARYVTEPATYPLYLHWHTRLPKDTTEAHSVGTPEQEWSFLALARRRLRCSVTKCEAAAALTNDVVIDPNKAWQPPAAANDDLTRICSVSVRRRRAFGEASCRRRSGVEYLPAGCVCGSSGTVSPFPKNGNKIDVVSAVNLVDKTPLVINRLGVTAVVCVKVGPYLKECEALKPNEAYGVDQDTTPMYSLLATPGEEVPSQLGELLGDTYSHAWMVAVVAGMMTTMIGCAIPAAADGPLPFGDSLSACLAVAKVALLPKLETWLGVSLAKGAPKLLGVATALYNTLQGGATVAGLAHSFVNDVDMEGYRAESGTILNTGDRVFELKGGLFDVAEGYDDGEIGLRFDATTTAKVMTSNITNIIGKDA